MRMKPGRPLGAGALRVPMVTACVGARPGCHHALRAEALAGAQVVQVHHRDRAQARKARIAENSALPAQHAHRGRAGQRVHGLIHLGQQDHVGGRVAAREGLRRRTVLLDQRLACRPATHQPRDLRTAVAAEPLHVPEQRTAVGPPQAAVGKAPQDRVDPTVAPDFVIRRPKLQRLRPLQNLAHLLQGPNLRLVHVDHHAFNDRRACPADCPSASYPLTPSRLIPRWKRLHLDAVVQSGSDGVHQADRWTPWNKASASVGGAGRNRSDRFFRPARSPEHR